MGGGAVYGLNLMNYSIDPKLTAKMGEESMRKVLRSPYLFLVPLALLFAGVSLLDGLNMWFFFPMIFGVGL